MGLLDQLKTRLGLEGRATVTEPRADMLPKKPHKHATELPLIEIAEHQREPERVIFIAGLHRSGTTLLEHLLHAKYDITVLRAPVPENEGQHLQDVYENARRNGGPGGFAFSDKMNPSVPTTQEAARAKARLLACWTAWMVGTSDALVEKSPPNLTRIAWLRSCFPGARFVVITRDPRAVAAATRKWAKSKLETLIRHWEVAHDKARDQSSEDTLWVSYEALCSNTEVTLGRVAEHCELAERNAPLPLEERFQRLENSNGRYLKNFPDVPHDPSLWRALGYEP